MLPGMDIQSEFASAISGYVLLERRKNIAVASATGNDTIRFSRHCVVRLESEQTVEECAVTA